MALKKKSNVEETAPIVTEEVAEEMVEATIEHNEAEVDEDLALRRLTNATTVVKNIFHLGDDYVITKFNDKGRSVDLTLNNIEFTISVTIKDTEMYGIN